VTGRSIPAVAWLEMAQVFDFANVDVLIEIIFSAGLSDTIAVFLSRG
jgi:hypothetical protein